MTENDFRPFAYTEVPDAGMVRCLAPSNIALVKYWGKREGQLPANPSLSFTLDGCATTTDLSFRPKEEPSGTFDFSVFLDGVSRPDFAPKIETFFARIEAYVPFLRSYAFEIRTSNTFPHSSGIASSASGMAALALALVTLEKKMCPDQGEEDMWMRKASFLARLGSGSATRSLEGPLVHWGVDAGVPGSSDLYGVAYPLEVHPSFSEYRDTIMLVESGRKAISSTQGHDLMKSHPFAERRFGQAQENLAVLRSVLASGDLAGFVEVVEHEALTLHAMMMAGRPGYMLMRPGTLGIIEAVRRFRFETAIPLCFTLDAGANVHLLYPGNHAEETLRFIREELAAFCEDQKYICDKIGPGARVLAG